jgi:hypothetical protein
MLRCRVFLPNKPAPFSLVLLSVCCVLAMAAGARSTGAARGWGTEALSKGYEWFPDPVEGLLLVLSSDGHCGGGKGVEKRRRSRIRRLGWGISPLEILDELRRLIILSGSGRRQPVLSSPGYLLVEGRPDASTDCCRRSSSFLPAWCLIGRQLCIFSSESIIPATSFCGSYRQCGGDPIIPSGFVPGDGGIESGKEMFFGPNCDFGSRSRVLSARFRDLLVILLFVVSCADLCNVCGFE